MLGSSTGWLAFFVTAALRFTVGCLVSFNASLTESAYHAIKATKKINEAIAK